jgi:2-iminobutanoate/2-iminopropanoate deaminase
MINKKAVSTKKAPQAIGPYFQGVAAGEFLFVSGQLPIDPDIGKLVEGGIRPLRNRFSETWQVLSMLVAGLFRETITKKTLWFKRHDFLSVCSGITKPENFISFLRKSFL